MHKFFCNYNPLTQKFELMSGTRNNIFRNNTIIQEENNLLSQIKNDIQELYENIVFLKEREEDENRLDILDDTELLISNLYYSLFESPLELVEGKKEGDKDKCKTLINNLIQKINIPEYNRLCILIKNNLEQL